MKYHLFKKSRVYTGRAYSGPTSNGKPAEADTLAEAIVLQATMTAANPVGWDIFVSKTKEQIA